MDGKIVAIGDNVRVWITPGDDIPECSDPAKQIMYYNGNNTSADGGEKYSDIFIIHEGSGFEKGGKIEAINKIQGNKMNGGSEYKDYIFLQGAGDDYKMEASDPNTGRTNELTAITVLNADGKPILGTCNFIEGIIYGDGLSVHPGDTTATWTVTLNLDIQLESSSGEQTLTHITLKGIPEGAEFKGNGLAHYTYDNGVYTLTFETGTTHYEGKMTITLPDGEQVIGDIVMNVETSAGDHTFDGINGEEAFSDTVEYDYDDSADNSELQIADLTDGLGEESVMMAMDSDHQDDASLDANQDEEHALQTADNLDHTEEHTVDNMDDVSLDTADNTSDTQDTDADKSENLLVDNDPLDLDNIDDESDRSTTDSDLVHDTNAETEESSLSTLLGGTEDDSLHETETASEETSLNSESNESGQEATIISQDEPLSFSDMIHDGDNKDLSSLIQTTETTETAETPNDVEHVPAEGGDTDDNQTWASNDPDDLIAKPEVEA